MDCERCRELRNARRAYRRALRSENQTRIRHAVRREEMALYAAGQLTAEQESHTH